MGQVNQFSTSRKGDIRDQQIDFGFEARDLYFKNRGGVPVYINFQSSSASTQDHMLLHGEELILQDLSISRCGITTTSTVTSTGDDANHMDILALG